MILLKTEEAFRALYADHAGGVKRFLLGMVGKNESIAEELTQDAFLKAWKQLSTFSARSSLKTWVYAVAVNTARDWIRAHKSLSSLSPEALPAQGAESPEVRAVREALLELELDVRELLLLHYYEEFNLAEIAEILHVPEGTVKSRLHHAKLKLRPLLLAKGFNV